MDTHIPDLEPEITFKTSRSGGKGGQNVNKVSTKVELNFVVADSQLLSEEQKAILLSKLQGRLTKDGMLQIVSQTERSQPGNKRVALEKFYALLTECFIVRKKRKATRVPKAVKEKRLLQKKRNAEIKRLRRNHE
jgi:ribosome-associated protein